MIRVTKSYFQLPQFNILPKQKTVPILCFKDNTIIHQNVLSIYKRFLRLANMIEFSDSHTSNLHYKNLFLSIVKTKFKVQPVRLFNGKLVLHSDIDVAFKLKIMKKHYHDLSDTEQLNFLNNIDNTLQQNYLFFTINQFENFYHRICQSLLENNGFLQNFLNESINIFENPKLLNQDKVTNYNHLLYGTALNVKIVPFKMINQRIRNDWKSIFGEISPSQIASISLSQRQYNYFGQLRDNAHLNKLKNDKNIGANGPVDKYIFQKHLKGLINNREQKKYNTILTPYVRRQALVDGFNVVDWINKNCSTENQITSNYALTHQFLLSTYFKSKIVLPYIKDLPNEKIVVHGNKYISSVLISKAVS
ncbi:hypothetical protein QEN19_001790 [Hanseniaspora menglaensis]